MGYINDWHDYVRVLTFFINLYSLSVLFRRYRAGRNSWNTKTVDLWYSLTMWTITGVIFSAQGVYLDRPLTVGFVFLVAATLVGGKGLRPKDEWGGRDT